MLRGNEIRPHQEILQFINTYRPGESNELVEIEGEKSAWNGDHFRQQAVENDEFVGDGMFGNSDDDFFKAAGQFTPELP